MLIPVEITGIVVLSVVITVCTFVALGFCLWPTIQDIRKTKQLEERRKMQADSSNFANVGREHV